MLDAFVWITLSLSHRSLRDCELRILHHRVFDERVLALGSISNNPVDGVEDVLGIYLVALHKGLASRKMSSFM